MAFARQFPADALACLVDALAFDDAVGAGKIDVLEDAEALGLLGKRLDAVQTPRVGGDDLARCDIAHEFSADDVKRAGLRGDDPRLGQAADNERPYPKRVAQADDRILRQRGERIGAFDLVERIDEAVDDRALFAGRDQMVDDFGVARRVKQAAAAHELFAQLVGVGEIAVVADRQPTQLDLEKQRLDIAQRDLARRRIADMTDRGMAGKLSDDVRGAEIVADEPHAAVGVELLAVIGDDSCRLLAAMLQRVQAKRGQRRGVRVAEDAEDAAFLMKTIRVAAAGCQHARPRLCLVRPYQIWGLIGLLPADDKPRSR